MGRFAKIRKNLKNFTPLSRNYAQRLDMLSYSRGIYETLGTGTVTNMASDGFNPLRWKCENSGCFNEKKRAKIEIFAKCFPGRIAMSDVDATVEINGHFLFVEFKDGRSMDVPSGQRIYFERITAISPKIVAVIAHMDIEAMSCRAIKVIKLGVTGAWEICTTETLIERMDAWAKRAAKSPSRPAFRPGA